MSGRVVHFEVPFDDQARAAAFYGEVFDWDLQPMPEMAYVMVTTGPTAPQGGGPEEPGFINGGMFQRGDQISGPVVTIGVDDIDATLEQVAAHGGSTVEGKTAVGDMGFAAYVKDSEGNVIGLWQNAEPEPTS